ncbi:hypothetical protein ACLJYM_23810 [Rhizobium giardinii]
MLQETVFSWGDAGTLQTLAFVGGAVFHIGFFVWVAYLVWK